VARPGAREPTAAVRGLHRGGAGMMRGSRDAGAMGAFARPLLAALGWAMQGGHRAKGFASRRAMRG
jgi:hypothetical protein